jgi:immune inhibitor A
VRHPEHRRSPLRPVLLLTLIAATACAASPPVPGKKGPQAPHYARSGRFEPEAPGPFRSGARAPSLAAQTYQVLALRIAFSDTPIESTTAYYDRQLLFLSQYWNQVSDGQVVLQTTLWDSVFTLPLPMSYYGDDDRFQERLVHLVRDAVQAADPVVDFRPVQSLILFHAGAGQEADVFDDSRGQIWSAFVTPDDFDEILPDTTGLGRVGIATNDTISGGVVRMISEAVEVPERESQDGYAFGLQGVLVHEFGHQLGRLQGQISMPDLYDTDGEEGGSSQGIGAWCIMGGGVWNANGFVPSGPSAWTKLWLGFLAPSRVTSSGPQSVARLSGALSAAPRALQIPITQSEYFLIENRDHDPDRNGKFTFDDVNRDGCFDFYQDTFAGAEYDFFLPANLTPPEPDSCDAGTYVSGSGIVIYHVDDAKIEAGIRTNTVNADAHRKGVDVEEADGIQDLDHPPTGFNAGSPDDVFRSGWRDRFTPDTTPSTAAYPDERTAISVTDIGAADSVMTLTVTIDHTRPGWPKTLTGRIRSLPSVAADLDGDGSLEIVVPVQRLNNTGAIYVFRHDGTDFLDGDATPTPFASMSSAPSSSPCIGDVDGVAGAEIVFQTLDGAIYAFHANGTEVLDGDVNPSTLGVLAPAAGITAQRSQPILVDLNGDGALDVVLGGSANPLGSSTVRAISVSGGTRTIRSRSMVGATEGAPAAADLDGDGLPEVILANTPTNETEFSGSGLSIMNWEFLTDTSIPDDFTFFVIRIGGPYSAPVLADLDRSGVPEITVADVEGSYHAFRVRFAAHEPSEPPNTYVTTEELPGWPARLFDRGRTSEVSIGDLEREGYAEVIHTGDEVRVAAIHYNGAPRAGYPLRPAAPFADADTAGFWPPLVADVDGDLVLDVIPILPDGRRPAYRADGSPIEGFVELGSTGAGAPPMLLDFDGNGSAEWLEAYDSTPTQATVTLRDPWLPVAASGVAWGQYRNHATRNAFLPAGPASPSTGTKSLTAVYAYPNPSRTGATTIHYRLGEAATSVSIRVLDPTGETVAELPVSAANLAGSAEHAVSWDHRGAASGVYLCRVEVRSSRGTEVEFTRLAIVR